MPTSSAVQILLIIRTPPMNGPNTTHVLSRMFTNNEQIIIALSDLVAAHRHQQLTKRYEPPMQHQHDANSQAQELRQQYQTLANNNINSDALSALSKLSPSVPVNLIVQDFMSISFEEQVRLIAASSIVIGMHGAGIAGTMHMSVGTKYCCGVIEIFPEGEFKLNRGYSAMSRRLGHYYERLNVPPGNTGLQGSLVPVSQITSALQKVLGSIVDNGGSCVLRAVVDAPFL